MSKSFLMIFNKINKNKISFIVIYFLTNVVYACSGINNNSTANHKSYAIKKRNAGKINDKAINSEDDIVKPTNDSEETNNKVEKNNKMLTKESDNNDDDNDDNDDNNDDDDDNDDDNDDNNDDDDDDDDNDDDNDDNDDNNDDDDDNDDDNDDNNDDDDDNDDDNDDNDDDNDDNDDNSEQASLSTSNKNKKQKFKKKIFNNRTSNNEELNANNQLNLNLDKMKEKTEDLFVYLSKRYDLNSFRTKVSEKLNSYNINVKYYTKINEVLTSLITLKLLNNDLTQIEKNHFNNDNDKLEEEIDILRILTRRTINGLAFNKKPEQKTNVSFMYRFNQPSGDYYNSFGEQSSNKLNTSQFNDLVETQILNYIFVEGNKNREKQLKNELTNSVKKLNIIFNSDLSQYHKDNA